MIPMTRLLRKLLFFMIPLSFKLRIRLAYYKLTGKLEPELTFVLSLTNNRRKFVDIGANAGIYSLSYSSKFKTIEAFEPLVGITKSLVAMGIKNITLHNIALSSRDETRALHIPIIDRIQVPDLATFTKPKYPSKRSMVITRTLDLFDFSEVDLIKIDTEGYELEVLKGTVITIRRNNPVLLIEIEQRHNTIPIESIFKFISDLGYLGYFLQDGKLRTISVFDYTLHQLAYLHQPTDDRYVNNFIFLPNSLAIKM